MKKLLALLFCGIMILSSATTVSAAKWMYKQEQTPQKININDELWFTIDDIWSGFSYNDAYGSKYYVFSTEDYHENLTIKIAHKEAGINEESLLGTLILPFIDKECNDDPTIEYYQIGNHVIKTWTFASFDAITYADWSFCTKNLVTDFLYTADVDSSDKGFDSYINKVLSSIAISTEEDNTTTPTPTPTPSVSKKDVIAYDVRSRINSEYTFTDIDSITVNDDYGTGSGYIVLVNLTWNQKNSAETTKDMLTMYSNDLAATMAEKHTDVNEIAVFWKVPYLTDKTSKWSYTCSDGKAYIGDTEINF